MVIREPAHDPGKGPVGRTSYVHGCRCQECKDANAAYARGQRAAKRASAASTGPAGNGSATPAGNGSTWDDGPAETGPEPAGLACPGCGDGLVWTTGRAGVKCLSCEYAGPSPDIARRTEHARTERARAVSTAVVDRGADRRAARELRGTKAEIIVQIEAMRDKYKKGLNPRGLSDIASFIDEINAAADDQELSDIVAEFRAHPWKDRKNHFYNFRADPDEVTGDQFNINENAGEDQCEVYLIGEKPCQDNWAHEFDEYYVCSRHGEILWPDEYQEATASKSELSSAKPYITLLADSLKPAIAGYMSTPVQVRPDMEPVRKCFTVKGEPGFTQSDMWPPVSQRSTGALHPIVTRNLMIDNTAPPGYCPYHQGAQCRGEADYQIYAPDIDNLSVIWACQLHAMMIGCEILTERISSRSDWIGKIRETYYIRDTPMGLCQLEPKIGPGGSTLHTTGICQRAADMKKPLGGIRVCPHHYRALMSSISNGYMPGNITELANRLNYS